MYDVSFGAVGGAAATEDVTSNKEEFEAAPGWGDTGGWVALEGVLNRLRISSIADFCGAGGPDGDVEIVEPKPPRIAFNSFWAPFWPFNGVVGDGSSKSMI